jgi:hypothetical protein
VLKVADSHTHSTVNIPLIGEIQAILEHTSATVKRRVSGRGKERQKVSARKDAPEGICARVKAEAIATRTRDP